MDNVNLDIIKYTVELISNREIYTSHHVHNVAKITDILLDKFVENHEFVNERKQYPRDIIIASAILHDIGKISIPESILNKTGKLTPQEFGIMKTHTLVGEHILSKAPISKDLKTIASIVALQHHERLDGQGYPLKLVDSEIIFPSRLIAIADVCDALLSERPYKKKLNWQETLDTMCKDVGHFDLTMLNTLSECAETICNVFVSTRIEDY